MFEYSFKKSNLLIRVKKLFFPCFLTLFCFQVCLPLSASASEAALLVSLGMPDQTLKSYLDQARDLGIPVVIRGLYTQKKHQSQAGVMGSFEDTVGRIKNLIADKKAGIDSNEEQNRKKGLGASIYPNLFRAFKVGVVPALVVYDSKSAPCIKQAGQQSYTPCFSDSFDIAYGNTPMKKLLSRIADQSQSNERAQYAMALLHAQEVYP